MRSLDKFRGCLLAGAAGDALGFEVEFLSEETIFERFGETGITEYYLHRGVAEISDDTQMTLFTATGLLLGTTRGMNRGIMGSYESYIRLSYKDWLRTQTDTFPLPNEYHYLLWSSFFVTLVVKKYRLATMLPFVPRMVCDSR